MDEETIAGPLKGAKTKEEQEVQSYKPPSNHRLLFKRRVFEVEQWIAKQGMVESEQVVNYIMKRWNLDRPQALGYLNEVINDFEKIGKVYGK